MRFLVTGATGFIGKNLVQELRKKKHLVKALARETSYMEDVRFLDSLQAQVVYGDLLKPATLQSITDNVDIVVHLGGILGGYLSRDELKTLHIQGTENLLAHCGGKKFIYCSSAGVLGPVINGNEETLPRPSNTYEKAKLEAEELVQEHPNHIILRPEFVYGPHDRHVLKLFRAIKNKKFFIIGDGRAELHPTYITDVTTAIIHASEKDISNQVFMIAGATPVSVAEFYKLVAEEAGVFTNKWRIPKTVAASYSIIVSPLLEKTGIEPLLNKSRLEFFTKTRTFSTRKARRLLDFSPEKLKKGLKKTIDWYKKEGYL